MNTTLPMTPEKTDLSSCVKASIQNTVFWSSIVCFFNYDEFDDFEVFAEFMVVWAVITIVSMFCALYIVRKAKFGRAAKITSEIVMTLVFVAAAQTVFNPFF